MERTQASRIHGLQELIRQASDHGEAPVEKWNPPYCGDIGLKIDARGQWSYRDSLISRMALVKLFARVLRCETDGRHFMVTPAEKVDVVVADAPFLAVEMEVEGVGPDQTLIMRTNLDDIVRCGPDNPLLFREQETSGGLKPYVRVRGRLYARLTRPLYFDLIDLTEPDPACSEGGSLSGELHIWSGGQRFPVVPAKPEAFFDFQV